MSQEPSEAELIGAIRDDVLEAREQFEIYRTYKLRRTRLKYYQLLSWKYDHFFAASLRAHFSAMVSTLGRVFDANPKHMGLSALLARRQDLRQVEPQKHRRAQRLWGKVLHIRHQMIAHRPSSTTIEQCFERANISVAALGELTSLCVKLVDAWSRKMGRHVWILDDPSTANRDLIGLLNALLETDDR